MRKDLTSASYLRFFRERYPNGIGYLLSIDQPKNEISMLFLRCFNMSKAMMGQEHVNSTYFDAALIIELFFDINSRMIIESDVLYERALLFIDQVVKDLDFNEIR